MFAQIDDNLLAFLHYAFEALILVYILGFKVRRPRCAAR